MYSPPAGLALEYALATMRSTAILELASEPLCPGFTARELLEHGLGHKIGLIFGAPANQRIAETIRRIG
jgi:hypothetical protein